MTDRASTPSGRLYTEGTLANALRHWGKDYTALTVTLAIEAEAAASVRAELDALRAAAIEWRDTEDAKRNRIDHDGQLEIDRSHANGRLRAILDAATEPSSEKTT